MEEAAVRRVGYAPVKAEFLVPVNEKPASIESALADCSLISATPQNGDAHSSENDVQQTEQDAPTNGESSTGVVSSLRFHPD